MRPAFASAGVLAPRMRAITCVEVVEGDDEALEDVGPRLGLAQLEGGAPADHLAPEVDEELAGLAAGSGRAAAGRRWPA